MDKKEKDKTVAEKKMCLETSAVILSITGIFTGLLAFDYQGRLDKAQTDYEALTPSRTVRWDQARWDREWNSIQDLEKARNQFLYTSIAALGSSLILIGIDLFILDDTDEQALFNPGLSIMLAGDTRINYQYRW